MIYLLIGERRLVSQVLITTSVSAFKDNEFDNYVAFVDCNNRFNPYIVSKLAVSKSLSPKQVLEHILIARAFTYDQMVELLENRINTLENIDVLLISGITTMWPNYDPHTFEELLRAIGGIKQMVEKVNPLIVITAPLNIYSDFKPVGGNSLYHFGHALILMEEDKRVATYKLIQHPYLPEKEVKKYFPRKPKRKAPLKNLKLDAWL